MINLSKRIEAFNLLREQIISNLHGEIQKAEDENELPESNFKKVILSAELKNAWFTKENIEQALQGIAFMLTPEKLNQWLIGYPLLNNQRQPKKTGVILAGNIPMVGFHDFLCVLLSGNIFYGKLSSKDDVLLKHIASMLCVIEPEFKNYIFFEEHILKNPEAIIATGSNNTSRYFEYYFGKYPNIIRKNRNSIAVLSGNETEQELEALADDIFSYFGLGCRNVSKLLVPENYDFSALIQQAQKYKYYINHNKYANNYHYFTAIYGVSQEEYFDANFFIIKRENSIYSPICNVFFQYYDKLKSVNEYIIKNSDNIQCVVSHVDEIDKKVGFGKSQLPELWDYADDIDTMNFLLQL